MAFQVSPGVVTQEIDLTTVIPAVSTSIGAVAGVFSWGPAGVPVLISSEPQLVQRFLKPSNYNAETWFTAANFLAYSGALYVSRAVDATTFNAVAAPGSIANTQILNTDAYKNASLPSGALYFAKYPGLAGDSLRISVCDSANAFSSVVGATFLDANNSASFSFPVGANSGTVTITNINSANASSNASAVTDATALLGELQTGDRLLVGNTSTGKLVVQVLSLSSPVTVSNGVVTATIQLQSRVNTNANVVQSTVTRSWEFSNLVPIAPGTSDFVATAGGTKDELHVVVVDDGGVFTGVAGTVLEVFQGLSRGTDALTASGQGNYYKNVLNGSSQYVWWAGDSAAAVSNTSATVVASTNPAPLDYDFVGGFDSAPEASIAPASVSNAYDLFTNSADITINLLMAGKSIGGTSGELIPNYLINNIATERLDCVVFVSPPSSAVVNNVNNQLSSVLAFRALLTPTSYAFMDSGYKYQYDKYNDVYRYVPLNGDMAGLCAQTDQTNDPWWAPAGFNRGNVKNIVKLAYNPSHQADRDALYVQGVNPVVTFAGQGTVLFGQKTLQSKPSAFDRLNVRRLFIVLEKAISLASQYSLFEFNDSFTRANFVNMVEPFLRDVQGRRGIYDFKVICDTTNNTPDVIDSNRFIGSIYIKPTRVAEFINLQFIAVATGVDFSEVVGNA